MQIPGIQAGHCLITPTCRQARGLDGAWTEACDRLKHQYELIVRNRADIGECDFHLALVLDTPRTKAEAKKTVT